MRTVKLPFDIYEEGDRVFTPEGHATVVRDDVMELAKRLPPKDAMHGSVFVKLDEPTSEHPNPEETVKIDRQCIIYESSPDRNDGVPRWNGKDVGFCTKCGVSVKEFKDDMDRCPSCGYQGYPGLWSEQYLVSINNIELRVLCIWAERWVNCIKNEQTQADCATILRSVVDRLLTQLPEGSILTLSDDIKAIREHGLDVDTNFIDL